MLSILPETKSDAENKNKPRFKLLFITNQTPRLNLSHPRLMIGIVSCACIDAVLYDVMIGIVSYACIDAVLHDVICSTLQH